jgi:hypothetical protein
MRVADLKVGLLAYYVGTDNVYALLVDQQGDVRRFRLLSCRQASPLIDDLRDAMEQPLAFPPSEVAAVFHDFCHDWGRRLLPPPEALEPFDVLVVVPHHFLHGLPLHLVSAGGDGAMLSTSHGVTYCSSGTLFVRCVERNRARFADPRAWTFAGSGTDGTGDTDGTDGTDGDAPPQRPDRTCVSIGVDVLTGKDAAYRDLAASFAGRFRKVRPVATREELKNVLNTVHREKLDSPDAICIVCHGYVDPATADRSGLLLCGRRGVRFMRNYELHRQTMIRVADYPFAEIPAYLEPVGPQLAPEGFFEPETLTVGELKINCTTEAELVALFGCSTGTGSVGAADEFDTLAYQWLKAGAASVLANMWEADLLITDKWVQQFVANWLDAGQPKAIAARNATRSFLAQDPGAVTRPYAWGSLALFGDWL